MSSPFPGMDPYLESEELWPAFQKQLATVIYQTLFPVLIDRYRTGVQERTYVTELPLFTSVERHERHEEYIEVRRRSDGRLVTLIDIASPVNKTVAQGRAAYLQTRKAARAQNANVVEIDLVLQGEPLLHYSRDGLPEWDYAVTVTRTAQPERFEIYSSTLARRLPRFKLPLAPDERDTVLDLQAVFSRAFEEGEFERQIDYRRDLSWRIPESKRAWVSDWLKQMQLR